MNRTKDLVSVIIPVYNCEEKIERCLKSIVEQSYKALEIIVVDDQSTDGTEQIINNYAQIDCRITYVKLPCRGG